MDRKIIDHISNDLWKEEKKFRKDKRNAPTVLWEKKFFKELKKFGYDFKWSMQFSPKKFTEKDKAIIPIFIEHLDKLEDIDLKSHYIFCLAVKGFYDATEYLLEEYEKNLSPSGDVGIRSSAVQALEKIQDPRYVDRYLSLLNEEPVGSLNRYFASLLGKMRIEKAIPSIIRLLDKENKIDDDSYGTEWEDEKYLVSKEAIKALARFKDPEHIKYIEKFLEPEKLPFIKYPDTKDGRYLLKITYREYKKIAESAIKKMGGSPVIQ